MKKGLLLGMMIMAVLNASAQDFKTVLGKAFNTFDTTNDPNLKVEQSNRIALIAKKWDAEWLGHYYSALTKTMLSYDEKDGDKRDAYLDDADKEKAAAVAILKKETDETFVLAAMIANARLVVNPSQRWMKYGKVFSNNLESAQELNANDPRIYYLQGNAKFHTPKAFGGGKKAAKPYLEKAEGLFAKESKDDIAKPYWGYRRNSNLLGECKQDEKE